MESLTSYIIVAIGVFFSSCSQLLLKQSARQEHRNKITELLNLRVLSAYIIFFLCVIINIYAMANGVKVKDLPILESLGYVYVPILSYLFLKERISLRKTLAIVIIMSGLVIFYM